MTLVNVSPKWHIHHFGRAFEAMFFSAIKQLLDEVEHDIMNYQNRGVLSAEAEG